MVPDYYGILGVARDATSQDIKKAFREIARKCHPDVAGADADAEERFKAARQAYETLMDPVARARYDRRAQRRAQAPPPGGSFFDAFYRATGTDAEDRQRQGGGQRTPTGKRNPGNAVSLDDLFNDFGSLRPEPEGGPAKRARTPPPAGPRTSGPRTAPTPGDDVHVDLEVPADVARDGGSVTAVYYRMQRADSWRPGAPDAGTVRVQDIADVRIIPGTGDGTHLRERGLGNAGPHGGAYGDLVATVRIVGERPKPPPSPEPEPKGDSRTVDISVVEALLGGRVSVETPQGSVRVTIPPGTSSGTRMRLKGRGAPGPDGLAGDLYVVTRIVVPKELDLESRRLVEEFARLNPSLRPPEG